MKLLQLFIISSVTLLFSQRPLFLEVPNALDCLPCHQCATLCNELEQEMKGKLIVISGHMAYKPPIDTWGTKGTLWRNKHTGAKTRKPSLNGNLIVDGDSISGQQQMFNVKKVKDSLKVVIDSLYNNTQELLDINIKITDVEWDVTPIGTSDKKSKIQCTFNPKNGMAFHDSLHCMLFITSGTMNHKEDYYKKHPWANEIYSVIRKILPENPSDTILPYGIKLSSFDDVLTFTYDYNDHLSPSDVLEMTCVVIVEDLRTKEVIAVKEYNGTIWDGSAPVSNTPQSNSSLITVIDNILLLNSNCKQANIKIHSLNGKLLLQKGLHSGQQIDLKSILPNFAKQLYLCTLESESIQESFKIGGGL